MSSWVTIIMSRSEVVVASPRATLPNSTAARQSGKCVATNALAASGPSIFIFLCAGYSTHKRFVLGGEDCAAPFACKTLVSGKTLVAHQFKLHSSLRYDARSMTLRPDCQTVSLAVCHKGRITGRLQMSARMRKQLQQGELGSAELVYRKKNFYLHISITIPAPEVRQPQGSLGVDLGFNRVAVTSDN